jgi:glycosyltransferase involved in cell wall biosynthesis
MENPESRQSAFSAGEGMSKYTCRLLFDVKGWAYWNRCAALAKYAPDDFTIHIGGTYGKAFRQHKYDLVLQLVYVCAGNVRKHIKANGYPMVLVSGFNVAASRRSAEFKQALKYSDHVVINSQACWEACGRDDRTSWISNGVDREIYRISVPPEKRKPKVLTIGSTFHAKSEGKKGFSDVLPEVERILKAKGLECDFRCVNSHKPPMKAPQMSEWYNTGTIYLVASANEGTPNPALEAASAGCVVVATPVGNMPELIQDGLNGRLVDRDPQLLAEACLEARDRYHDWQPAMEVAIRPWHWAVRGQQYYDLFRRLIDERRA